MMFVWYFSNIDLILGVMSFFPDLDEVCSELYAGIDQLLDIYQCSVEQYTKTQRYSNSLYFI